jgi:hypothetical protein
VNKIVSDISRNLEITVFLIDLYFNVFQNIKKAFNKNIKGFHYKKRIKSLFVLSSHKG